MKVGIIGANWSLKVHGASWRRFPGVEVAAVCTAHKETAERAAAAYGVPRAYWDVAELAADPDIDIIDVGSRPAYRYDMVMKALAGGKHVYNALPFAADLEKAKRQARLASETGLVGVVDAQFRWVPAAMKMKEMIDEGFLGTPLGFNADLILPFVHGENVHYPYAAYPPADVQPYKWLAEKESGASSWRNYGSHMILLLTHMIGQVASVTGMVKTGVKEWNLPDNTTLHPETDDLGCAVMQMENGAIGTLQTGWCKPDAEYVRFEVWGDRGRLVYTDRSFGDGISARLYAGEAKLVSPGEDAGRLVEIDDTFFQLPEFDGGTRDPYMVSMGWMFHNMLAAIRGEAPASPSFEEALHTQKVVEALLRSSEEGRRIDIAQM